MHVQQKMAKKYLLHEHSSVIQLTNINIVSVTNMMESYYKVDSPVDDYC